VRYAHRPLVDDRQDSTEREVVGQRSHRLQKDLSVAAGEPAEGVLDDGIAPYLVQDDGSNIRIGATTCSNAAPDSLVLTDIERAKTSRLRAVPSMFRKASCARPAAGPLQNPESSVPIEWIFSRGAHVGRSRYGLRSRLGERSEGRTNRRNGYRERDWDTRA
jgi:hypothetical protein